MQRGKWQRFIRPGSHAGVSGYGATGDIHQSGAQNAGAGISKENLESFPGLVLKAQAQSQVIILALVDLKHPRQDTFVKQANIANGPQQMNNAGTQATD